MPQKASVDITAKAGKETVQDKIDVEVDAYVSVIEEVICANARNHKIDLFIGPKERVDFLVISSSLYERPTANGCTPEVNGKQPYIRYAFFSEDERPSETYPLKHAQLFAGELAMCKLPNILDKVVVDNNLTEDIKISILATRTKNKECDPTQWENMPAQAAAAAN